MLRQDSRSGHCTAESDLLGSSAARCAAPAPRPWPRAPKGARRASTPQPATDQPGSSGTAVRCCALTAVPAPDRPAHSNQVWAGPAGGRLTCWVAERPVSRSGDLCGRRLPL